MPIAICPQLTVGMLRRELIKSLCEADHRCLERLEPHAKAAPALLPLAPIMRRRIALRLSSRVIQQLPQILFDRTSVRGCHGLKSSVRGRTAPPPMGRRSARNLIRIAQGLKLPAVEIPSLGCKKRTTLVILGAGATRGASFVETDQPLQPPVDRDFFRVLQVSSTGRSDHGRRLLSHVRTVYGAALNVGLETVFNNLDAARTFHSAFNVTRGRHIAMTFASDGNAS